MSRPAGIPNPYAKVHCHSTPPPPELSAHEAGRAHSTPQGLHQQLRPVETLLSVDGVGRHLLPLGHLVPAEAVHVVLEAAGGGMIQETGSSMSSALWRCCPRGSLQAYCTESAYACGGSSALITAR